MGADGMRGGGAGRLRVGLLAVVAALLAGAAAAETRPQAGLPPGTFLYGAELARTAILFTVPEPVGVRTPHLRVTLSAPGRRSMHLRLATVALPRSGAAGTGLRGFAFTTAPGQDAAIAAFLASARAQFAGMPARITVTPEGAFCALAPVPPGPLPVRFQAWAGDRPMAALRHDLRARAPLGAMGRDLRHPCPEALPARLAGH
jgi:hypothetical protein